MITRVWLDLAPRAASAQMAIDTAMVEVGRAADVTLLRLYRWLGDTVSLGANERAVDTWDRDLLDHDDVAVVRRPTGGRAVWHDHDDLTYAWSGPADGPADVRRIYREVHERLAEAIAAPGRAISLAGAVRSPGLAPGACFEVAVGGEVLIGARKVIGSAQRVYGDRLLQHGAIAVDDRALTLARYRRDARASSPAIEGSGLESAEATAAAIAQGWLAAGATTIDSALASRILLASEGHRSQYDDPAWTWRR